MALLKMHGMMAAGVAAVALVGGGTAAAAVIASGPVDSAGVVHGCYAPQGNKGSYQLDLQKAGTNCPKGFTAITWNQKGPQGPAGATGATGATGPQGPAGPGLVYTTASGTTGPAISAAGTYFIDVTVAPFNNTGASAALVCGVQTQDSGGNLMTLFAQTYQLPGESSGSYTLSGMATLTAGAPLSVHCFDVNSAQSRPIEGANWYVAPVQTTG